MNLFSLFANLSLVQGLVSDVEDLVGDIAHKQPVNWQKFLTDLLATAKTLETAGVITIGGFPAEAVNAALDEAAQLLQTLLPKGPAAPAPTQPPTAPPAA